MDSILHIGSIAGVPQELSAAQRRFGLRSDVLSFESDDFGYGIDFNYPINLDYTSPRSIYISNPLKLLKRFPLLLKHINNYDVLHFHYSSSLPSGLDFPIWKMLRKVSIIHHHGSDIRKKGEKRLYKALANRIFVSTPDLLQWSKDALWIPNPIDTQRYSYLGPEEHSGPIRILHAARGLNSARGRYLKGSNFIISAVNELINEGYNIDLILVENMQHHEAVESYKQADIVVDQLLIGWYGMLSQECMALGKPICVYIREDLEQYMPFCPFLNTNTKNIVDNLRLLIEDSSLRIELAKKGRDYVEKVHEANMVARMVTKYYK